MAGGMLLLSVSFQIQFELKLNSDLVFPMRPFGMRPSDMSGSMHIQWMYSVV